MKLFQKLALLVISLLLGACASVLDQADIAHVKLAVGKPYTTVATQTSGPAALAALSETLGAKNTKVYGEKMASEPLRNGGRIEKHVMRNAIRTGFLGVGKTSYRYSSYFFKVNAAGVVEDAAVHTAHDAESGWYVMKGIIDYDSPTAKLTPEKMNAHFAKIEPELNIVSGQSLSQWRQ